MPVKPSARALGGWRPREPLMRSGMGFMDPSVVSQRPSTETTYPGKTGEAACVLTGGAPETLQERTTSFSRLLLSVQTLPMWSEKNPEKDEIQINCWTLKIIQAGLIKKKIQLRICAVLHEKGISWVKNQAWRAEEPRTTVYSRALKSECLAGSLNCLRSVTLFSFPSHLLNRNA